MKDFNINPATKQVHKCSICKENFFWSNESCWFGYEENKKGNRKILEKCCSRLCFNKSKYQKEDPEFIL